VDALKKEILIFCQQQNAEIQERPRDAPRDARYILDEMGPSAKTIEWILEYVYFMFCIFSKTEWKNPTAA